MNLHDELMLFTRKALIAIGIATGATLLVLAIMATFEVLLLVFAGVLLAVFMRGTSNFVVSYTRIPEIVTLTVLWLLLGAAIVLIPWEWGPGLAADFNSLFDQLPKSLARLREWAGGWDWARQLLDRLASGSFAKVPAVTQHLLGWFSTLLGGISSFLLILVLGFYFSMGPRVYISGLIKLVPRSHRDNAWEVLGVAGRTLFGWVLTRIVSMVATGALVYVGLLMLGVPQAAVLAFLAGVLTFVPYLGAIISAVPAILVALGQSPMLALYVVLLYLLAHLVEGYLITPLVQWRFISMPPALVLAAQVLMGLGAGIIGIILASPLVVVIRILAELLYVRDTLHDEKVPLNPHKDEHQYEADDQ